MKKTVAIFCLLIPGIATPSLKQANRAKRSGPLQQNVIKTFEDALGIKADLSAAENVAKITIPKNIKATIQGKQMMPFMGKATWFSFQQGTKPGVEVMAMGDILLLEHEVNPALRTLLNGGVEVTALHNHFFYENPKLWYAHINAEGSANVIAQTLKRALEAADNADSERGRLVNTNGIKKEPLEAIMNATGTANNGMVKFVFGRQITAKCGCVVGKTMGANSWMTFAGTDQEACVGGDFALLEDELQSVLKSLARNKIDITAIHNHFTHEDPRLIFVHFWGTGSAVELARALRDALDQTGD